MDSPTLFDSFYAPESLINIHAAISWQFQMVGKAAASGTSSIKVHKERTAHLPEAPTQIGGVEPPSFSAVISAQKAHIFQDAVLGEACRTSNNDTVSQAITTKDLITSA
ncbi:hypothetical protein GOP47_0030682 [Adiantum capillus-veneris]|nr:hypothetical protein GOP47_0030682 [Adiantum capillus-veneris]